MPKHFTLFRNATLCLTVLFISISAFGQIKITSPADRSVYQRDVTGQTTVSVLGTYLQPVDKVEFRAVPVIPGQGVATDWGLLQDEVQGGIFNGTVRLQGGWYTLEVRASLRGTVVGRDVVARMGVGEVFVISGQSNAQGLYEAPGPAAIDDRVSYIMYDNTVNSLFEPPAPVFGHLDSDIIIGPRGQTAWNWGLLGDQLTRKLNVPVLFINTAWEGTAVGNWAESAEGKTTFGFGGFQYPTGMPYGNLLISTRHYVNQLGARAILWMQGETDTYPVEKSADAYQRDLQYIINKLGGDTDKRITWVIARTSRNVNNFGQSITSQAVINGQNAVINTPFNSTYPGPETDNTYVPRPDGVHFKGLRGLQLLADAWNNTLNTTFFSTITPVLPTPTPSLTTSCSADNNQVTLSLPAGFSSYSWSTGQTGRSINVTSSGTYRATLKDAKGNAIFSPAVTVGNNVKPVTPVIVPGGQQQACADSGFVFTASGGTDYFLWSDGSSTQAFKAQASGSYTVRARNVFGCESAASAPVALTVRPRLSPPLITQSGPYSVTAAILETGLSEKYEWRLGKSFLKSESPTIKITESGDYSARAQAEFKLGSNTLTCYSAYSLPFQYVLTENDGVVIFPNPTRGGSIFIETLKDIPNAEVAFYNTNGSIILSQQFPLLNQRRTIDASTLTPGIYIVRVRAAGLDVTKRIVINR